MNNFSGEIYAFDNVPGNIFNGRKHGIFNTNKANSTRAAITVCRSEDKEKGFNITNFIRFKQTERKIILNKTYLNNALSNVKQIVSDNNSMFFKCDKDLIPVFNKWKIVSDSVTLSDYIAENGKYILSIPSTCRYFTVASNKPTNRNGQFILAFDNYDAFLLAYALINSSFAYWYWRIYDGGITYSKSLILSIPFPYKALSNDDKFFFKTIYEEMIQIQNKFVVQKNNVGSQESIKFPKQYRDRLNERLLSIIGIDLKSKIFNKVHANNALGMNDDEQI